MRLIDADDFEIDMQKEWENNNISNSEWIDIRQWLKDAPTIEAEPVIHGKWIFTNKPNIYGGTSIKCSECGYEGMVAHIEDHHYCWFCGAKMNEVNDEVN